MSSNEWLNFEHKVLKREDGKYFIDIDITVNEWKEMLCNETVFYKEALEMICAWYKEEDYRATSKTMMTKYCPHLKGTPYNGIVCALSTRIINYLKRFWVEDSNKNGKKSFWCIPFEGWHQGYDTANPFVWKLRTELITALDELKDAKNKRLITTLESVKPFAEDNELSEEVRKELFQNDVLTTPVKDGKRIAFFTTKYERNPKNRAAKIRLATVNGQPLKCEVCGICFETMYGELGKDFIEVHHNKPLFLNEEEQVIDPAKDLNCVCPNCHRMLHREKGKIITVKKLKEILLINKKGI